MSTTRWPSVFVVPAMPPNLSVLTRPLVKNEMKLVIELLFGTIRQHTIYPNPRQYAEAAKALVNAYPQWMSNIPPQFAIDYWKKKLINKFGNERRRNLFPDSNTVLRKKNSTKLTLVCCVSGCHTGQGPDTVVFSFPSEQHLKDSWRQAVGFYNVTSHNGVCALHFHAKCIVTTLKCDNKNLPITHPMWGPRLVKGAVPTLLPPYQMDSAALLPQAQTLPDSLNVSGTSADTPSTSGESTPRGRQKKSLSKESGELTAKKPRLMRGMASLPLGMREGEWRDILGNILPLSASAESSFPPTDPVFYTPDPEVVVKQEVPDEEEPTLPPCVEMSFTVEEAEPPTTPFKEKQNAPTPVVLQSIAKQSPIHPRDEFDAFAEYVAAKLRVMPLRTSALVKKAMCDLLFEAEMGKFGDPTIAGSNQAVSSSTNASEEALGLAPTSLPNARF